MTALKDPWPKDFDIPPCFRGLADALEAFIEERANGFDGSMNEYLDMERHKINRDAAQNHLERGAQDLIAMGEHALARKLLTTWLDKAS